MKIYRGIEEFNPVQNAVVTSGTFDGVHLGHKVILKRLIQLAKKRQGESVVLTFWPHPRFVLYPNDTSLKLLSTFQEKASYLSDLGIDHLIKIEFTKKFSQLSSEEFIHNILIDKIGTKLLVIGYDHRFGKNREGSFQYLANNSHKYGFEIEEIPRQDIENIAVSSTKIRNALESGEIKTANEFIGNNYRLTGKVIKGSQIGRDLGFPTANIVVEESYKLIPADGSYAVKIEYQDQWHNGMLNIGFRPTVNGTTRTIETHIFDFNQNLYGQVLTIGFVEKIRGEKKFENLEALSKQLTLDRKDAMKILD
ncbi:MAG: bifunctional riboflavin kinase/FAD synthetase [Bacteroidetes bacterium]|nr:bifunctional riboflavin kinase/FAD synthetase [Bacteroidota bacterium]